jgi:diguanylate cyclase (GGDEF)-like protein
VIDIQTIILTLSIGNIGFALLMAGYIRGSKGEHGLVLWMLARLLLGASQLFGWLKLAPWSENVEAVGTVAGVALELAAYCVYFQLTRWERILAPVVVLSLLVMAYARATGASYVELLALTCLICAMFVGATAYTLLRPGRNGKSLLQRILGVNDVLFAVAMAIGGWYGVAFPATSLGSSSLHTLAALAAYLLMIVNGVGFLLLCKQKGDEQMAQLATTDFLTGLANRRAFFEQAEVARTLALRLKKPIALLMLDLDHFKQLNDRFGHATGDEALVRFAGMARATLREHDLMGRLGGEEFALALPGTDVDGALLAAERLRQAVAGTTLEAGGVEYAMTVSVGAVMIEAGETLTAALARADQALYRAKRHGRNRVEAGQQMLRQA